MSPSLVPHPQPWAENMSLAKQVGDTMHHSASATEFPVPPLIQSTVQQIVDYKRKPGPAKKSWEGPTVHLGAPALVFLFQTLHCLGHSTSCQSSLTKPEPLLSFCQGSFFFPWFLKFRLL